VTDRLYYTDSYLREFDASVVDRTDGGRRIYLDRTAFYPTSGGQPFDTGRLGTIEVRDVVDEGDRIAHVLAEPLAIERVTGILDWPRRFDHMQQHTGQHLLSSVVADLLGRNTLAVHFGREVSTIDLDGDLVTAAQIARVEDRANDVVTENRSVIVSFEEATEALGLRKHSPRTGTLRVITIEGLDRSACGGTHVRATGEIGMLLIRKVERIRKGVRLEFLCGGRAVKRAREDHALLTEMSRLFSAAPLELPHLVTMLRAELKEAVAARRELEGRIDLYRARELYTEARPDPTGIRRALVREPTGSLAAFRGLAQAYTSFPMSLLVAAIESPPAVMLSTSADSGVDAAGVLKSLLTGVGGKGGGSARVAQGTVPGKTELETVLSSLFSTRAPR
jgi:alanyl-tRNA synthetase